MRAITKMSYSSFFAKGVLVFQRGFFFVFGVLFFNSLWAEVTPQYERADSQLQELIYRVEEQFADKMSPEVFQKFQMFVAKVGGRLQGRIVMPVGGESHWLKDRHPVLSTYQSTPELPNVVDVAIIGSGLGGVAAAERLSAETENKNLTVAVFDSRGVAEGATGQNGGNFQPLPESFIEKYESLLEERYKFSKANFPDLSEIELRKIASAQANTMIVFGRENGVLFKKILKNYSINADVSDLGWMRLANSAEEELAMRKDVELARSVGITMEMWSAEKITSETGIPTEFGGRFTPGYGNYHPYKFATQLFEKLLAKGILLYTHTRVNKVDWSTALDKPILLHTDRGMVRARKVIIATDAYTAKLIPEMKHLIEPFQSQVVTFEHVRDVLQGWTLTERDGDLYSNIPKATKYIDKNGVARGMYLVGGGPDRLVADPDAPPLSQEMFDVILEQTRYRFSELAGQPVSNTWTAVFAFTPLRLPYLSFITHDGVYDPRVIITAGSQGYGGGMSLMGGHLAAEMALMAPEKAEALLRQYDPFRFFNLPELKSAEKVSAGSRMCRQIFLK